MARGHQKFQSQQRNLKKQEELRKSKGSDQKAAAQKALTHKCVVCMALMPDVKTYKQHFESKHPKAALPAELVDMTRGHMKMQAKAKNLKKQEALKKSIGHDQKGACLKSLIYKCTVCMCQMMDKRSYKEHFLSKHPKQPLPAELEDVGTSSSAT
ncbi:unnamed protein product [Enterobius vermicularis]|uniref:4F5 domain-containing protein n=1 Tax=Enterobius vermicularis TaxID=51028 RepID=A0A0N4V253_ENTVE|nr:unnamed protein product [Enterobius vermicularis]